MVTPRARGVRCRLIPVSGSNIWICRILDVASCPLWMTPRGKRRCGVTQITIGIVMPLSRAMDWHGQRLCGEFAW
jgi:hypothetical protein